MANIEIRKVKTKKDLGRFIDVHHDLYEGNEYDAPTLFIDDMNTLSKDKNAAFDFCEADYYIAYKDNKPVGRVAAIINHKANEKWDRKDVRFGWLDMIDDIEVTKALFKAVEDYGRKKGMQQIVGPLGFTDMDPEGMLIEGFDQLGTMATGYNYPYYPEHMEKLGGWEKDNDYVEWKVIVPEEMSEKHRRVSDMIKKRYNLNVRTLTKKEINENNMGKKVFEVINNTFSHLYGYSQLSERQMDQYVEAYLRFADLEWIPVVEDLSTPDHELVGVGVTLPSLTRALQKCPRGRLLPFGWFHIIRALKFKKTEIADLLLIGVLPEYRKKGASALLFDHLIPLYQRYGIKWGETHVEMETNNNVQNMWQDFECYCHKRRRCYKKPL